MSPEYPSYGDWGFDVDAVEVPVEANLVPFLCARYLEETLPHSTLPLYPQQGISV